MYETPLIQWLVHLPSWSLAVLPCLAASVCLFAAGMVVFVDRPKGRHRGVYEDSPWWQPWPEPATKPQVRGPIQIGEMVWNGAIVFSEGEDIATATLTLIPPEGGAISVPAISEAEMSLAFRERVRREVA